MMASRDTGPPEIGKAGPRQETDPHHDPHQVADTAESTAPKGHAGSSQVSWWETHVFIAALVANCDLPMAGTPAWCALADGDPRKLLSLAVAGEHHVLRMEAAQAARAEASRSVSTSTDWKSVARNHIRRASALSTGAYIPRITTHSKEQVQP